MKKYEITNECYEVKQIKVFRVRALRSFGNVCAGDLGGFVESEFNLSQDGDCWIAESAVVIEHSIVRDNAIVKGRAIVKGQSLIEGRSIIQDNAYVESCEVNDCNIRDESAIKDCELFSCTIADATKILNSRFIKNTICGKSNISNIAFISKKVKVIDDVSVNGTLIMAYIIIAQKFHKGFNKFVSIFGKKHTFKKEVW